MEEFHGTYDVYEMLAQCPDGLPRPIDRYDVINLIYTPKGESSQIISTLLIDERQDSHLFYPRAQIEWRKPMRWAALPLRRPSPLPSYYHARSGL